MSETKVKLETILSGEESDDEEEASSRTWNNRLNSNNQPILFGDLASSKDSIAVVDFDKSNEDNEDSESNPDEKSRSINFVSTSRDVQNLKKNNSPNCSVESISSNDDGDEKSRSINFVSTSRDVQNFGKDQSPNFSLESVSSSDDECLSTSLKNSYTSNETYASSRGGCHSISPKRNNHIANNTNKFTYPPHSSHVSSSGLPSPIYYPPISRSPPHLPNLQLLQFPTSFMPNYSHPEKKAYTVGYPKSEISSPHDKELKNRKSKKVYTVGYPKSEISSPHENELKNGKRAKRFRSRSRSLSRNKSARSKSPLRGRASILMSKEAKIKLEGSIQKQSKQSKVTKVQVLFSGLHYIHGLPEMAKFCLKFGALQQIRIEFDSEYRHSSNNYICIVEFVDDRAVAQLLIHEFKLRGCLVCDEKLKVQCVDTSRLQFSGFAYICSDGATVEARYPKFIEKFVELWDKWTKLTPDLTKESYYKWNIYCIKHFKHLPLPACLKKVNSLMNIIAKSSRAATKKISKKVVLFSGLHYCHGLAQMAKFCLKFGPLQQIKIEPECRQSSRYICTAEFVDDHAVAQLLMLNFKSRDCMVCDVKLKLQCINTSRQEINMWGYAYNCGGGATAEARYPKFIEKFVELWDKWIKLKSHLAKESYECWNIYCYKHFKDLSLPASLEEMNSLMIINDKSSRAATKKVKMITKKVLLFSGLHYFHGLPEMAKFCLKFGALQQIKIEPEGRHSSKYICTAEFVDDNAVAQLLVLNHKSYCMVCGVKLQLQGIDTSREDIKMCGYAYSSSGGITAEAKYPIFIEKFVELWNQWIKLRPHLTKESYERWNIFCNKHLGHLSLTASLKEVNSLMKMYAKSSKAATEKEEECQDKARFYTSIRQHDRLVKIYGKSPKAAAEKNEGCQDEARCTELSNGIQQYERHQRTKKSPAQNMQVENHTTFKIPDPAHSPSPKTTVKFSPLSSLTILSELTEYLSGNFGIMVTTLCTEVQILTNQNKDPMEMFKDRENLSFIKFIKLKLQGMTDAEESASIKKAIFLMGISACETIISKCSHLVPGFMTMETPKSPIPCTSNLVPSKTSSPCTSMDPLASKSYSPCTSRDFVPSRSPSPCTSKDFVPSKSHSPYTTKDSVTLKPLKFPSYDADKQSVSADTLYQLATLKEFLESKRMKTSNLVPSKSSSPSISMDPLASKSYSPCTSRDFVPSRSPSPSSVAQVMNNFPSLFKKEKIQPQTELITTFFDEDQFVLPKNNENAIDKRLGNHVFATSRINDQFENMQDKELKLQSHNLQEKFQPQIPGGTTAQVVGRTEGHSQRGYPSRLQNKDCNDNVHVSSPRSTSTSVRRHVRRDSGNESSSHIARTDVRQHHGKAGWRHFSPID